MKIEDGIKLDYSDVLIRPKRSSLQSRQDVSLTRDFSFRWATFVDTCIPIWSANMDTTGTLETAKAFQYTMFNEEWMEDGVPNVAITKHYTLDDWKTICYGGNTEEECEELPEFPLRASNMAFSCGMSKKDLARLKDIIHLNENSDLGLKYICLDVANGYTQSFVKYVQSVRELVGKNIAIIAGNVVTREMTEALILAGADIIKVGIGPGSACTTRKVAGVGYPQLSAVAECADAAHGLGGHVMADGGCTSPGDVAKAFAAGADFVMIGGMFAGHDESGGDAVYDESGEITHKTFYGMSSTTAMEKHNGGVATYRASEGRCVTLPYRGSIYTTLRHVLGGVRSACTYVGANSLKDLPKCASFIRVNNQYNRVYENVTDSE